MPIRPSLLLLCALISLPPCLHAGETDTAWELHGILKNESAWLTRSGSNAHRSGELLKNENSLNLFLNGHLPALGALHVQLNPVFESEGNEGSRSHQRDTQNDLLREVYLDKSLGPVELRIGKQQEVWGTADGIKLLDIVNPTDYREFVQNTMADSRIPVWMAKASTPVGGGNLQVLAARPVANAIPGMSADDGDGQAFIMKGVDTITGRVNGFTSITPQLGKVAGTFHNLAVGFGLPGLVSAPGFDLATTRVQDFIDGRGLGAGFLAACPGFGATSGSRSQNAACLDRIAQSTNKNQTLLIDAGNWNEAAPNSPFEFMNQTTFATFNTFVNANTAYRRERPGDTDLNLGVRYKNTIGGNFNYSLNYLNHRDPNPYIALSWENGRGETLATETVTSGNLTSLRLRDGAGNDYGAVDPVTFAAINRPATLIFTEKTQRINSLGASFDTSVESQWLGPVVLRGEALYQLDTKTPLIDRDRLAIGDLAGAMQTRNTDWFKYVLGAEFIVLTNLTISGQWIQFVNLDFVDEPGNGSANSGRYSADQAVMHLGNGLKKVNQYKEFGSLFLSKPLGLEQQGRINNLTMVEEHGGWWNRLDGEWKWNDSWVSTAEYNQYWGNPETMFGQFGPRSNVQVGLKYIF
ncbi:MAG: RNA polymerase-associated protein rapA [Magnetococcales bacterium]|nr:RNA polymerase-associated protein rapA [Magnetococcales bacterium]